MTDRRTRVQSVDSERLQILSLHLQHNLGAPLPCYASITAVETGADLRYARVYFRLVGDEGQTTKAKDILAKERAHFQRAVSRELKMKFCPVLQFEFGVVAGHDPIDQLLQNLRSPQRIEY